MTSLADRMTEAQLLQKVVALAQARGWMTYHTFDSRRSAAGFPDIVAAKAGYVVFLELKSATGSLTAQQREWIEALRAGGADARVVRPSDWPEIVELLERKHAP